MTQVRMTRVGIVVCVQCLMATPALAQHLGQGDDVNVPVWRVLAALALVLMLGIGAVVVARSRSVDLKLWQGASTRRLKVVETVRLSPQGSLCLAVFEEKEYLIAITPGSATVIDTRSAEPDTV
jgi:Flagellar biosynthesis protein, FliO